MAKHIFIGDVHGKVQAVEAALAMEGKKIFVGDFIDSYDRSHQDHAECYRLVNAAILSGEAQAIYGNHELSYLRPRKHRCSGFDLNREAVVQQFEKELRELWKPYIFLKDDLLVSHAGLTCQIWDNELLGLDTLPRVLETWWPDLSSPMHNVGYARGGPDRWGGMFWCDFNHEFEAVPGLNQIFGHTRGRGIRKAEQQGTEFSYCIDCLDWTPLAVTMSGDSLEGKQFLELDL